MSSLSIGLTLTGETPSDPGPPPETPPVSLSTIGGFPVLENVQSADGSVFFTLSGTSDFAGVHEIDAAEQALTASGPVNEVAPALTGTLEAGSLLSCDGGLWAFDPDLGVPGYSFQWLRGGQEIPAATGTSYEVVAEDEGQTLQCRVTASQAVGARSVLAGDVADPPSPAGVVERVGSAFYTFLDVGTEGEVTVDLSAYGAGDTIVIFTGVGEFVASGNMTVDGIATSKLTTDAPANFGARQSAFSHVLDGPGSATTLIRTVGGLTQSTRYFAVYAMRGYQISAAVAEYNSSNTLSLAVDFNLAVAQNAVLSCAMGLVPETATWVAADESAGEDLGSGSVMTSVVRDLPIGAAQQQVSFASAGRASLISIILEGS